MQRDADTSMMADRNDSERLGDFCFWTDGWMNKQTVVIGIIWFSRLKVIVKIEL